MNVDNHAIERLTALLAAGFEMDPVGSVADAVTLTYPCRSIEHRHAIVYATGLVVFPISVGKEARFYTDSPQEEFQAFVGAIPKPPWWKVHDRVRGWMAALLWLSALLGAANWALN